MYGMANLPNGTGYKLFHTAPYQIAAKSGTSQVFSLKENQTYNAKMIPVRLRDHIFIPCLRRISIRKWRWRSFSKMAAAMALSPARRRVRFSTISSTRRMRRLRIARKVTFRRSKAPMRSNHFKWRTSSARYTGFASCGDGELSHAIAR